MSGLSSGNHTIKIELYDGDGNKYTNIGASAETTFLVSTAAVSYPVLSVISPRPNQTFSTSSIEILLSTSNFPIIPSGQHVRYQIDGGTVEDHNTELPINIDSLSAGEHTFSAYLVDENGISLGYTYGSVSIDFIVGLNPEAVTTLYYAQDFVKDLAGKSSNLKGKTEVDVANVIMANIYSPIDLQVISYETSANSNSIPSILIGKLRSQSWGGYLSGSENSTEMANRLLNKTITNAEQKKPLNPDLADVETDDLVFGSNYMDALS